MTEEDHSQSCPGPDSVTWYVSNKPLSIIAALVPVAMCLLVSNLTVPQGAALQSDQQ
jgi:hypothetical protein